MLPQNANLQKVPAQAHFKSKLLWHVLLCVCCDCSREPPGLSESECRNFKANNTAHLVLSSQDTTLRHEWGQQVDTLPAQGKTLQHLLTSYCRFCLALGS